MHEGRVFRPQAMPRIGMAVIAKEKMFQQPYSADAV
jgi:hypothetical protein